MSINSDSNFSKFEYVLLLWKIGNLIHNNIFFFLKSAKKIDFFSNFLNLNNSNYLIKFTKIESCHRI